MNPKVYLIGSLHPQRFPRAVVQLVHDVVKIFRRDGGATPVLRFAVEEVKTLVYPQAIPLTIFLTMQQQAPLTGRQLRMQGIQQMH